MVNLSLIINGDAYFFKYSSIQIYIYTIVKQDQTFLDMYVVRLIKRHKMFSLLSYIPEEKTNPYN